MMLPMSLSTITDAHNALGRLTEVFLADERSDALEIDPDAKLAIRVVNGDFQWESVAPDAAPKSKKEQAQAKTDAKAAKKAGKKAKKDEEKAAKVELKLAENAPVDPETAEHSGDATADVPDGGHVKADDVEEDKKETMQLRGINLTIPRGQLCAIVGPVGSGKSSLLQALVGEMKRTSGEVAFGGTIAYAAQQPWMQSCSLKVRFLLFFPVLHSVTDFSPAQENILFGRPYDEIKYKQVIADACLESDIQLLPDGDETEIGEKGPFSFPTPLLLSSCLSPLLQA